VFDIPYGTQKLSFSVKGAKSVILVGDTFRPMDIYKTSDSRRLGIRLIKGIHITDGEGKVSTVSLYSMYNQKKIEGFSRVQGTKLIKVKYSHEDGKINLQGQVQFNHHRAGWGYVLNLLTQYHREEATMFDGFLENTFAWIKDRNVQMRLIPYREPWVGVFHNPSNVPNWFAPNGTPSEIIESKEFQESLGTCKGLYTLSKYHTDFLRCFIKTIPVETLYHPTETPEVKFDFNAFVENSNKKIVNIGWWCRRMTSIYKLNVDKATYQKIRLIPPSYSVSENMMERLMAIEKCFEPQTMPEEFEKSVVDVRHMSNDEYDDLLSKNIAFLDLYDSSANNAIIECMARGTPILVNPIPAVVEYLGEDYPLYFRSLEEASKKVKNLALIKTAHDYLMNSGVSEKITPDYFLKTIREGAIWKSLL
jgi:hypothetical protein